MAHTHPHTGPSRALAAGLALTLAFAAVEAIAGVMSGSLALIADAGHMVLDSSVLLLALAATAIARRPSDLRRTYGYVRAEVLVVPLQVALMLGLAAYIVYEAFARLGTSHDVDGWPVLAVGAVGLGVNLVVLRLLRGHVEANLNAKGASLEVLVDAIGSAGVIVSAIVLLATGWTGIDIVISLAIAALVIPRAVVLMRHVVGILLEGVPPGIDVAGIERDARAVTGVAGIHDLHVWALTPSRVALSAHVELTSMGHYEPVLTSLTAMLRERHGVGHVTLQAETAALHEEFEWCAQGTRASPIDERARR